MPSGLAELSKGIQADPEDIEQVGERLRKMSGLELRKFGRAAQPMADPDDEFRHAQSGLLKHSPDSVPVVIPSVDVAVRPTYFIALNRIAMATVENTDRDWAVVPLQCTAWP
jgi:hypothetical protein